MPADPRGTRRHREHRLAGLRRIQQLHLAGVVITCCIEGCGKPIDPFQPYRNGRNPAAPTLEHKTPLSSGGALFQDNGPDCWAHRGCQNRQGGQISSARQARPTRHARNW